MRQPPDELLPIWLDEVVGLLKMAAIIVRALVVGLFNVPVQPATLGWASRYSPYSRN